MILGASLLVARPAAAGRGAFGWLVDTPVNPERIVEIETWVWETNHVEDGVRETYLWWGPTIGITDQVELALPIELEWARGEGPDDTFTFDRFGAELRWRLVTSDPVEAPKLVPLIQLAAKRLVGERSSALVEADAVVSYDAGRAHLAANAGVTAVIAGDADARAFGVRGALGASVRVVDDLRLGAELVLAAPITGETDEWIAAGPQLAWTHGRFWLSASFPIGPAEGGGALTLPRLRWGIAF